MTKFKEYQQQVRERLVNAIKLVPPVGDSERQATVYAIFADKMAEVAVEQGVWPWKQTLTNSKGTPKDLATAVKRFALGKVGMNTPNLELIELACLYYEMAARVAKGARAGIPFTGATELPEPAEKPEKPVHVATEDPEIAALYAIQAALDTLEDTAARRRVLAWAGDKFLA